MRYILVFFLLFFTACSFKNPINHSKEDKINSHYAKLEFEQSVNILPKFNQYISFNAKNYKKIFFKPWHSSFKNYKNQNLFWAFPIYLNPKNKYYFFNKQEIPISWFKKQIDNANIENIGQLNQKALIIQNTLLKNIPTQKAILKNPFLENEGFPFDYSNDAILNIATPVLISHYTKDKRYAFILSETGIGFVESKNLEIFSNSRAKIYEKLHFITPLKEKEVVFSEDHHFFFETRIGAIYPYYKQDKKYFYGKIGSKKYRILKKDVAKFPLKLNDSNLKNQLSQMLSLPYGWGGYNLERDCSLFTRDIFSAFGLYLPRNSRAQKNAFYHFNISMLNNAQKKDFLNQFGKAYTTLLYIPGHIMLYAGKIDNNDIVIHNIWGLRKGKTQRLIIGESAITSLEIGKKEILEKNLLLSRIKEISFIDLNQKEINEINGFLEKIKDLSNQ
ncbi:SH3 domain-containing protein [Campylobacter sp. 2018MI35]|uniref:SH3 domain-containing C40 family peptidase n=1 Tax=Campylobacter molothri TaxID=1032242 RepID=UPI0019063B4F|nr:SH3 domain-containing C40 family peptidase [Campylobacter sp. 2018MI35]MBK1999868.1 SH3 domain-containing protein [Campylobacter sp. 2018MI35]MBZ7932150.1 SH3 domain-containing protein [Campylobacter sp. RM10543]MBZ7969982.1 SH3 domain-containing protein [Campylobacter sp. RM3125]MBZ7971550.1 SH3 domain-containing protein [Campylobacter sp. RM3124]